MFLFENSCCFTGYRPEKFNFPLSETSNDYRRFITRLLTSIADMIEKGRDYDGVDRLRRLFDGDFDVCFKECLKEEVLHLLNKKRYIYAETLNAYDYYIKENRN